MGSREIKRRRRPPEGEDGASFQHDWELRNAPFTFEGEIEGLSRFGRGLSTAPHWMRVTAWIVAATFLLPFAIYLVLWIFLD